MLWIDLQVNFWLSLFFYICFLFKIRASGEKICCTWTFNIETWVELVRKVGFALH